MGKTPLRVLGRMVSVALFLLVLNGGGARAAVIGIDLDVTVQPFNFINTPTFGFFQVGGDQATPQYSPVAVNDGDTVRVTMNFTNDQAVRVSNGAGNPNEVSIAFLGAGQLVNPGPTAINVTFDFSLSFLGATGDLLAPTISQAGITNAGGGFGPAIAANLTDSAFLFQGVQFEFANIRDNNAANGATAPNEILPRNFDTVALRLTSSGPITQVQAPPLTVPEPSGIALLAFGLLSLTLLGRRQPGSLMRG